MAYQKNNFFYFDHTERRLRTLRPFFYLVPLILTRMQQQPTRLRAYQDLTAKWLTSDKYCPSKETMV